MAQMAYAPSPAQPKKKSQTANKRKHHFFAQFLLLEVHQKLRIQKNCQRTKEITKYSQFLLFTGHLRLLRHLRHLRGAWVHGLGGVPDIGNLHPMGCTLSKIGHPQTPKMARFAIWGSPPHSPKIAPFYNDQASPPVYLDQGPLLFNRHIPHNFTPK